MSRITADSFLATVRKSELVETARLKKCLEGMKTEGIDFASSKALATGLVARGVLTDWQVQNLLKGKYRGYTLGKYRLLSLLGKGGMSSVYLAEHTLMKRRCAIKVLPSKRVGESSYLGRFHREAQAVASLDHVNIVRAYDVDHASDKGKEIHFLVMEYVEGRDLQQIVDEDGPLGFTEAAEYVRQSAEGLAHAHESGLVHRDVKPANLLVDLSGVVKILDMGLARFFDDQDEKSLTVANDEKVLGTADYLAPEQAIDSHSADHRADVYGLGCSLYFALCGHPPFNEGTLAQRLLAHQTKEPKAIEEVRKDIPESLATIIRKMMAKDREVRYQDMHEVSAAFREWLVENADPSWTAAHTVAPRGSDSFPKGGSNEAPTESPQPAPETTPVVEAEPAAAEPAATTPAPPVPEPAAPAASTATEEPEQELNSFLANLGGSAGPEEPTGGFDIKTSDSKPEKKPPSPAPVAVDESPVEAPAIVTSAEEDTASVAAETTDSTVDPQPATPAAEAPADEAPAEADPIEVAPVEEASVEDEPAFPAFDEPKAEQVEVAEPESVEEAQVAEPTAETATPADDAVPNFAGLAEAAVDDEPGNFNFTPDDSPATDAPVAAPVVAEAVVEEAADAAPAFAADSSPGFVATAEPEVSSPVRKKAKRNAIGDLLGSKNVRLGLVASAGLLTVLIAVAAFQAFTGGGEDGDGPSSRGIDPGLRDLVVGPDGQFDSLVAAVEHMTTVGKKKSAGEPWTVEVAPGTYSGSLLFDSAEFPANVRFVGSGSEAPVIEADEGAAAVTLYGADGLVFEGFVFDAADSDSAVYLSFQMSGVKFVDCTFRNYSKSGLVGVGCYVISGDPTTVEGSTFDGGTAGADGAGLRIAEDPDFSTVASNLLVIGNRFVGKQRAGVVLSSESENIVIRENVFDGPPIGVDFADAGVAFKGLLIGNNTFHDTKQALLFAKMPTGQSKGVLARNLFVSKDGTEVVVSKGRDPKKFAQSLQSRHNWSLRPKPQKPAANEVQVVGDGAWGGEAALQSTKDGDSGFLKPKQGGPLAKVAGPKDGLKPYIGALAP